MFSGNAESHDTLGEDTIQLGIVQRGATMASIDNGGPVRLGVYASAAWWIVTFCLGLHSKLRLYEWRMEEGH